MHWTGSQRPVVLAAVCLGLFHAEAAAAQGASCEDKLLFIVHEICGAYASTSGGSGTRSVGGKLSADVSGLVRQLVDLGGEFNASVTRQEYENILREDLPGELQDIRACRAKLALSLYDKICAAPAATAPAYREVVPPQAAPAPLPPERYLNRQAVISDPDGWSNVRSGKGTQYAVVGTVNDGEVFWTRVQDGNWWQIETRNGVVGYIHTSRIRLLPPS